LAKTLFWRCDGVAKLIKKLPGCYFVRKEFSFCGRSQNCEERLLVSSYLSIRLSAWNNSAAIKRTLMEFDIWVFSKILLRKFKFHQNRDRINGRITNKHFWFYVAHFILEWEKFQAKFVKTIKTRFMFNNVFIKSCPLWDNAEKYFRAG